ncbi:hypothetical protein HNO89_004181 [Sporosarcina luteola]|nr:hypothetical protein [Sporosarcina luteola]
MYGRQLCYISKSVEEGLFIAGECIGGNTGSRLLKNVVREHSVRYFATKENAFPKREDAEAISN